VQREYEILESKEDGQKNKERRKRNIIKEVKQDSGNTSYGNELGKGENYKTEYYRHVTESERSVKEKK
jgi:hypothetical protein